MTSKRPIFRVFRGLAVAVVLIGLSLLGIRGWRESRQWVETDNAYLDGPVHPLAARLIGTVDEVLVEENSRVKKGQILVRLDPRDVRIRREQSEAKLAEANASMVAANSAVVSAKADARLDDISVEKARLDLARMKSLSDGSRVAVAVQELEHAQSAYDTAVASVAASQSTVQVAEAGIAVAHAQMVSAEAALKEAVLQCEYTTLTAPVDGRVGRRNVEIGQPVIPAQPLIALVGDDLWLTANFKETQIARIRPGQAALIRFDAFPDREWPAKVESMSPASGSRFALLPPDNATGNFTRVVQRLPVRIRIDASAMQALGRGLVPGLSAEVRVKVADDVKDETPVRESGNLTRR